MTPAELLLVRACDVRCDATLLLMCGFFQTHDETRPAPPLPGRGALERPPTPSQSKIRAERATSRPH